MALWIVLVLCSAVSMAATPEPLTIDDALREARAHNATLPLAALDTMLTGAGVRAAKGQFWPQIGIDGDVHGGTPSQYASGDARLQLVAELPLYDGGRMRAEVRGAQASHRVSLSRYRIAERDLELEVRLLFSQAVELEEEVALREKGLARLQRYIELVGTRRESGEPVSGDLLKARVRQAQISADIEETRRQLAATLYQLKELLGREPEEGIAVEPLASPAPPRAAVAEPWRATPDVQAAEATQQNALTAVDAVRSRRRPHIDVSANAGTEPVLGSSFDAPLNTGRDEGAEVTLSLNWPLWDRGVYKGELVQARLAVERAAREAMVVQREAKLQWFQARSDLDHLFEVVRIREESVPIAEDAYLQAESLYRGGESTALEVLDAFGEWLQASVDAARATLDYRNAEARELRWGTP